MSGLASAHAQNANRKYKVGFGSAMLTEEQTTDWEMRRVLSFSPAIEKIATPAVNRTSVRGLLFFFSRSLLVALRLIANYCWNRSRFARVILTQLIMLIPFNFLLIYFLE